VCGSYRLRCAFHGSGGVAVLGCCHAITATITVMIITATVIIVLIVAVVVVVVVVVVISLTKNANVLPCCVYFVQKAGLRNAVIRCLCCSAKRVVPA
jgi:hypothetical protein